MEEGTLVMVKLDNDQNYKMDIFLAKMRRSRSKNEKTTKADELVRLAMVGLLHESKNFEK